MADTFSTLEDGDLVKALAQQQYDLVKGRFALSMGRLENTASLRGIRKDIARIKTEIRRRESDQGLAKDALVAKHAAAAKAVGGEASSAEQGGFLSGVVDKLGE